MGALVQVRGASRRYGKTEVVQGIELDAHSGEVLGLIGPNGGGKSTLLLLLAGLVRPTEGTVQVDGVAAHDLAVARTGTVGLITADAGVYPLLTGWENLQFFGGLFSLSPTETRRRATPMLDELDLTGHMGRRAGSWSSGMKQKLSLVRARLLEPKLLLLDEPTANLDPVAADVIYHIVRREADAGLAVVLVTHDLHAAETICDRVAIVEQRVRHVEPLTGDRRAPRPGRLLPLYQLHTESR